MFIIKYYSNYKKEWKPSGYLCEEYKTSTSAEMALKHFLHDHPETKSHFYKVSQQDQMEMVFDLIVG